MARRRKKGLERRIARERILILFQQAEKESLRGNLRRSNRYVQLARRIGMRYNTPFPSALKRRFCRKCGSFLLPSENSRVRLRSSRITITCGECGHIMRMPYLREKSSRR
ncbi:MAG: ribonuclease P [Candidatus Thermoplasmatota archaeon]|nr:ribonuclease P [Candidatus Thermoplasmatota archaeon]